MYLYHHFYFIHKSSCLLIFSFMVSWQCLSVCHNLPHLVWIPSDQISWSHWSVMSLTCGLQGFLDSEYARKYLFFLLLEFSFVWLYPISNDHIIALVPFICIYFYILTLEESYEALLINFMTRIFISSLSNFFFKLLIWYGFTAASIISMQWPNFSVSLLKDRAVMEKIWFISFSEIYYLHKDNKECHGCDGSRFYFRPSR